MQSNTAEGLFENNENSQDYLTITIADQLFGIPVLQVQDVLGKQDLTIVPLAPPEIAGSLNLRGRIVTAINVRQSLNLPKSEHEDDANNMSVVVEHEGELFSLIIDKVGDVLSLEKDNFEDNPATLDPKWLKISSGIYRLEKTLMVILDVSKLIGNIHKDELN